MKIKVEQEDIEIGVSGNATCCPVARAVGRQVPNARAVAVTRDNVTVIFKCHTKRDWKNDWTLWERITLFDIEKRMTPFEFELANI
jgi:metal-sulfur cluster biosynthetic enzyme